MSLYEDAMSLAVQLPQIERERLARALGVQIAPRSTLPLAVPDRSKTDPAAWKQAETGHAVLNTEKTVAPPLPENVSGAAALRGLWAQRDMAQDFTGDEAISPNTASQLPRNSPVLVHTDVVLGLALGLETTRVFWEKPPVEPRIATATYLKLLELCEDDNQRARVRAFVQPFAVLSLGPMASTKAAQLMLENGANGLSALDALIAATAIAHEIPLVARNARSFQNIEGLFVATLP
jgi:predicted nucleic acid-binding protein